MDIVLLSKMVKELILDNDKVTLPGLGVFVAEIVPSSFSDRGYTINPPYRKVSFKTNAVSDTLLADFYAANNNVARDVALKIITEFVAEMGKALESAKVVQLPGLGRLRTGRDGNIFFIADEELDIYPAGFGLEPISLKTHTKPTSFDFSTLDVPTGPAPAVDVLAEAGLAEPMAAVAEPEPESEPEVAAEPEPEPTPEEIAAMAAKRRAVRRTVIAVVSVLVVLLVVVGGFYVMVNFFPDTLDKLLYTEEELEILNYYKS